MYSAAHELCTHVSSKPWKDRVTAPARDRVGSLPESCRPPAPSPTDRTNIVPPTPHMARQVFGLTLLVLLGTATGAAGQETIAYDATREELQQRLDSLEAVLSSGAQSSDGEEADRTVRQAQRVQSRLENGDMQAGDMIRVQVGSDSILSGTYRVADSRSIDVPTVGRVDLSGLLYSEVADSVRDALGSVVRTSRIQVQPLIRVAVLGQVGNPGYYDLSPTATVSDALMQAGGPTSSAEVQETRLRKPEQGESGDGTRIPSLTGRSLAELGVTRGDEVFVPGSGGGLTVGTITTVLGIATSVTLLITRL